MLVFTDIIPKGFVMDKYQLLSDEQILVELGQRFDKKRIQKGFMDKDVIKQGGATSDALNKFRQSTGGITLLNFIRLLRGIDELGSLEKLLSVEQGLFFSNEKKVNRKRVRKSIKPKIDFTWGEDK